MIILISRNIAIGKLRFDKIQKINIVVFELRIERFIEIYIHQFHIIIIITIPYTRVINQITRGNYKKQLMQLIINM